MRQTFLTYAIKDTVALRAVEGHLLGSRFHYIEQVGAHASWAEILMVQVREGSGDEQEVIAIIERHAPAANLMSRGTPAEPIEGYRDGLT